jgi:hypothetical protein
LTHCRHSGKIILSISVKFTFSWATTDIVAPHYGQPTLWKFDHFITEWEATVEVNMTPVESNDDDMFLWESEENESKERF